MLKSRKKIRNLHCSNLLAEVQNEWPADRSRRWVKANAECMLAGQLALVPSVDVADVQASLVSVEDVLMMANYNNHIIR